MFFVQRFCGVGHTGLFCGVGHTGLFCGVGLIFEISEHLVIII